MDTLLNYMLSQYSELPLPPETRREWLEKWIFQQEQRCVDQRFSAQFPWQETGLPQTYFLQRNLDIDGRKFLTGPRYLGGNIDYPFIDIVASDSNIDDSVIKAISLEWAALKPKQIRILTPGNHKVHGITDQLVYAARLSDAAEYHDDTLTLRLAVYADYDWCRRALVEAYQHAWRTLPALTGIVCSVDDEDLTHHISAGEVFIFQEDGVDVGLIICEQGETAFIQGKIIAEEVIIPAFRGRYLASRAQRLLRNHLYHSALEDSLIIGTIIPKNVPSIKTAERAGRFCILKYQFFPVTFE